MFRTKRSRLTATIAAAAVFGTGAALAVSQMAQAHDDHGAPGAGTPASPAGAATFLVAALNGRNEIPGPANSEEMSHTAAAAVTTQIAMGHFRADSLRIGLTRPKISDRARCRAWPQAG